MVKGFLCKGLDEWVDECEIVWVGESEVKIDGRAKWFVCRV